MRSNFALAAFALAGCSPSPHAPSPPPDDRPPPARTVDVVEREHGIEVADPYRWMETNGDERDAWLRAQGAYAERRLAALPGRDAMRARVRELGLGVTAVFDVQVAGTRIVYYVTPAGEQRAKLATRDGDRERVLVDPAALDAGGAHASLHAYSLSPDGKRLAYVASLGGGERGALHVIDVATGTALPEVIDRIWGEGAAAWLPDGESFFYTQLAEPRPGVDPMTDMRAKLHVIGEPVERDVAILGRDVSGALALAPEEWPGLWVPPNSDWAIALIGGARSEQRVAIAPLAALDRSGAGKTPWREVAGYADGVESATIHGERLFVQTYKDAPNRAIVSMPLADPQLARARVELAEDPRASIVGTAAARDALYVVYARDGRARLVRWPWTGAAQPIELPGDGWLPDLAANLRDDGLVFQLETWLAPGVYYAHTPNGRVTPIGLASTTTAVVTMIVADEIEVDGEGGAKIPLTILHRRGLALDGTHPTILYGYAAYGAIERPGFSATRLAWLERGGMYAIAHGRGGGEKGRAWQDAGSREHKMTSVRDFLACAQALVARGYTSPKKLAAVGISMGGVLVGRALTERPELFAAVQLGAGIVDPLRILVAENGANQKAELGDPSTEAGYRSILAIDPYQHVQGGVAYPAVLFTIGLNDHRVAPWMSAKMAARLAAVTTSGKPILVRVESDAGHGVGSTRDQVFAERADVWSFFLAAFGS